MVDFDCRHHSGKASEDAREPYDQFMRDLPNNQSGAGRHKCPYCAYELGREHYRTEVAKFLSCLPSELPD